MSYSIKINSKSSQVPFITSSPFEMLPKTENKFSSLKLFVRFTSSDERSQEMFGVIIDAYKFISHDLLSVKGPKHDVLWLKRINLYVCGFMDFFVKVRGISS